MAAPGDVVSSSADAFFARYALPPWARARCWDFVRERYPGDAIRESASQGYCSFTFCVGPHLILQFRPPIYQIDVELTGRVTEVYGDLAPRTTFVGTVDLDEDGSHDEQPPHPLLVYSSTRVLGVSLADYRRDHELDLDPKLVKASRRSLIRAYAGFVARSWRSRRPSSDPSLLALKGKIGASLRWRLELMQRDLPPRFQSQVSRTLAQLPQIESLPWVLTHGDVVPSNVMVRHDPTSGLGLTGLLDWAEAEFLPFGLGLYGAEELLGCTAALWDGEGPYPPRGSRFVYFDDAPSLRGALWDALEEAVPELRTDKHFLAAVQAARDLGILLWHGIAFDDGRLDRVVRDGADDEEIQRLELFLGAGEDPRSPTTMSEEECSSAAEARPSRQEPQHVRRPSLSEVVKRAWTYLHVKFPEQILGKV